MYIDAIVTATVSLFLPPTIHHDFKFVDNFNVPVNNTWVTYDNTPLRESIRNYTKFPIATIFDKQDIKKQQPRLLLVSVDAEEGEVVTFDSYEKEDGSRKSEYGYDYEGSNSDTYADHSVHDAFNDQQTSKGDKDFIRYDQGIMVEHVMASASVPEHYDYTLVPKVYDYTKTEEEKLKDIQYYRNSTKSEIYRRFWDGGLLSNTPLRELIQAHQEYWMGLRKDNKKNKPNDRQQY